MTSKASDIPSAHERLEQLGARALSDAELVAILLGPTAGANSVHHAAQRLLDEKPLGEVAWATADDLQQVTGIGRARAAALVAAFELGRRGSWSPPKRGERLQDPARVFELLRHVAHADREQFHVVLLDVRCRLIKAVMVSEGSLTQCPVSPREVLREALRIGAHGVILGVARRTDACCPEGASVRNPGCPNRPSPTARARRRGDRLLCSPNLDELLTYAMRPAEAPPGHAPARARRPRAWCRAP